MQTVIGVFSEKYDAESAIEDLEAQGFVPKDMSVVVKDGSYTPTGSKGGSAAEGMASGAATGGVLGALAGLLIGIGAITIPGVGALLIGGPLAAALGLTGAAATTVAGATTGILAGGLVGGLVSLGIPENDARVYEERIRTGGILLAVPAQTSRDVAMIRRVFQEYDADQVREVGSLRRYD